MRSLRWTPTPCRDRHGDPDPHGAGTPGSRLDAVRFPVLFSVLLAMLAIAIPAGAQPAPTAHAPPMHAPPAPAGRATAVALPPGIVRVDTSSAPVVARFELRRIGWRAVPRVVGSGAHAAEVIGADLVLRADGKGHLVTAFRGVDPDILRYYPAPYRRPTRAEVQARVEDWMARAFAGATWLSFRNRAPVFPSRGELRFGPRGSWWAREVVVWWARGADGHVTLQTLRSIPGVELAGDRWTGRWRDGSLTLEPAAPHRVEIPVTRWIRVR